MYPCVFVFKSALFFLKPQVGKRCFSGIFTLEMMVKLYALRSSYWEDRANGCRGITPSFWMDGKFEDSKWMYLVESSTRA